MRAAGAVRASAARWSERPAESSGERAGPGPGRTEGSPARPTAPAQRQRQRQHLPRAVRPVTAQARAARGPELGTALSSPPWRSQSFGHKFTLLYPLFIVALGPADRGQVLPGCRGACVLPPAPALTGAHSDPDAELKRPWRHLGPKCGALSAHLEAARASRAPSKPRQRPLPGPADSGAAGVGRSKRGAGGGLASGPRHLEDGPGLAQGAKLFSELSFSQGLKKSPPFPSSTPLGKWPP